MTTQHNLRVVNVIHGGRGYRLSTIDRPSGIRAVQARRGAVCGLNGCRIGRNDYYLYSRAEGRLCCACGIVLGALEPAP